MPHLTRELATERTISFSLRSKINEFKEEMKDMNKKREIEGSELKNSNELMRFELENQRKINVSMIVISLPPFD